MDAAKTVDAGRPVDAARPVDAVRPLYAAENGDATENHLPPSPTPMQKLGGDAPDDDDPRPDLNRDPVLDTDPSLNPEDMSTT